MSDSIMEISRKHGKEMHILGLKHSLEMAKLFRDYGDQPIEQLIKHLEDKLTEESMPEHSRFDLEHIKTCDDCRRDNDDFNQEQEDDARLDAASEAEPKE